MKRKLLILLTFMIISTNFFADSFTDAIQDLAIQTACIGQYSATQAGVVGMMILMTIIHHQ